MPRVLLREAERHYEGKDHERLDKSHTDEHRCKKLAAYRRVAPEGLKHCADGLSLADAAADNRHADGKASADWAER